jgi:hypothetical protein
MSELKTNTTALRAASSQGSDVTNDFDTSFPTTLSKRDRRSSVADRTAMWNSQLQASSLKIFKGISVVLIVSRLCGRMLKALKNSYPHFQAVTWFKMLDFGSN